MNIDKIIEVKNLACNLMKDFGLYGWQFGYQESKFYLGNCTYETKDNPGKIHLGVQYVILNPISEIEDTIRHEIAHALTGKRENAHDNVWKCMAVIVGAKPEPSKSVISKCFLIDKYNFTTRAAAWGTCSCERRLHTAWTSTYFETRKICKFCNTPILWNIIKEPIPQEFKSYYTI